MPFLLKPRVKSNGPMVGSKTDSSALVSEETSKKSNTHRGFLIMNSTDITTNTNSTMLPQGKQSTYESTPQPSKFLKSDAGPRVNSSMSNTLKIPTSKGCTLK